MIYDMIKFIKLIVKVVGIGWVVSVGIIIYLVVEKENCFSFLNMCYMIY